MMPDELKQHRQELGLTQKQLASELCVTVRAVVSWETGARNMPLTVEKLFCLLFDLPFRNRRQVIVDDLTPDLF